MLLATVTVYAPVGHFDFVNFDDPEYVVHNSHVREGLTLASVKWALTTGEYANWFPVTRLSHIVDAQLFGMDSGAQHLTSVLFHSLAALCLFLFLRRATGLRWPSAVVAFVFALHPLHVESAAWIAERKDVLCAFLWFLALWAYARYAERPGKGRYLLVLLLFGLALMAKPMAVTLPLLLLLLDFWPLRRRPGLTEKIPFFLLSAASALATYLVQHSAGAVRSFTAIPFALRVENALVSCLVYLAKAVWPTGLAVYYPYPAELPIWQPALAAAILSAITILVWRARATYPYLVVGWLWYLLTLLPVIGLVQVGGQARADRYMYVPLVGLAVAAVFGAAEWLLRAPRFRLAAAGAAAALVLACAVAARAQVEYWKDSESLFEHALSVTGENYVAHHNLGAALAEVPGRLPEAVSHYQQALRIQPDSVTGHIDLANVLSALGQLPEAVSEYQAGLRLAPDYVSGHNNFGNALARIPGRLPEAIAEYRVAIRLDPNNAEVHNNLGCALVQLQSGAADAIVEFRKALELKPDYADARANLAGALASFPDRLPEAVAEYEAAIRARGDSADIHYGFAVLLSRIEGRRPDAIAQFEETLRLRPDFAEAHNYLGVSLLRYPDRRSEAVDHFSAAIRINPDYAEAHYNLGAALLGMPGAKATAIAELEEALRLRPDPKLRALVEQLRSNKG